MDRTRNAAAVKFGFTLIHLKMHINPTCPGAGIVEGFTHFVDHDSNNDYRLDMNEVIRAISRATDQVVDQEEVKVSIPLSPPLGTLPRGGS